MTTESELLLQSEFVGGVAGASARQQAAKLRAAAPVRTRLARLLGVHTDERAWRLGADGEERVARYFAKLPPEWTALHDLPLPGSDANIDHLVIGPGGVFTINTKNHPGGRVWVASKVLMVNGQRTAYLPKARAEAARAEKLLSRGAGMPVPVQPIVAVLGATLTIKERPDGVVVLEGRSLTRWLVKTHHKLRSSAVEDLTSIGRDKATWT